MKKSNENKTDSSFKRATKQGATFVVKIDHCQNNSWQGRVIWADEDKTEHFRSALELLRLMDTALYKSIEAESTNEGTSTTA